MSEPATRITLRHYQVLSGLALTAIVLLPMQQNGPQPMDAVMLMVGLAGILSPIRVLTPILVLMILSATRLYEQHEANQLFNPDFRSQHFLDLTDVLLCMAVLTYTIGHYRLYSLQFGALPGRARPRSQESLSAAELATLIIPVPLCALAAEFAAMLLKQHWDLVGLPSRWRQLVALMWTLIVVMFLAGHLFRYWRRLQMPRPLALLTLQDILWNETRGEQRRIERWIAWRKLRGY